MQRIRPDEPPDDFPVAKHIGLRYLIPLFVYSENPMAVTNSVNRSQLNGEVIDAAGIGWRSMWSREFHARTFLAGLLTASQTAVTKAVAGTVSCTVCCANGEFAGNRASFFLIRSREYFST